MSDEKWTRRVTREKNARKEAEKLLEDKSLELWTLNQNLEEKVKQRTVELENALAQAKKANKAKDDFLSSMSHEIRTPLNAIIGFVDIMIKKDIDEGKRKKYFKIIQQSGKNLLRVINDILDFSKLQSDKLHIHRSQTNIQEILSDSCRLFESKALEKNITFAVNFNENFPPELIADEIRIIQIMNNFISNAMKFTPSGKSITVNFIYENTDSTLSVLVEDTGIGIEKAKQESIFIPFEQEDIGTTREYGGTGLGLAICVSLIQMMDGELIFQSQKNVGSTFGFKLKVELPN
ncbi:ATP-binding protein [Sulfurimonas sp.]|nr:ATP-binding protein [Sulfurimonas sp.]